MKKFGLLLLALVLALGALGVGYAAWTDTVTIDGTVNTGEVCMSLVCPFSYLDNGQPPDGPDGTGYLVGTSHPSADWNASSTGTAAFVNNPVHMTKNVGWITTNCDDLTSPIEEVVITLHNMYPCYYNHISFGITNCGTIPIKLDHVTFLDAEDVVLATLTNDGYLALDLSKNQVNDVEIYWGDNFGDQIEPGEHWDLSFWIHIMQDEGIDFTQVQDFTFSAAVTGVQWNEYPLDLD